MELRQELERDSGSVGVNGKTDGARSRVARDNRVRVRVCGFQPRQQQGQKNATERNPALKGGLLELAFADHVYFTLALPGNKLAAVAQLRILSDAGWF